MPTSKIQDKNGQPIQEGDYVFTRVRGGSHQGKVQKIVTDEEEAEQEDVKNPPKVIYSDQHGHRVAHNPGTLEKTQPDE
ncbi:hypothetical protein ASPSYDRAFT_47001 [Aspergillus sydowii CBS 593.65]|uniref:Hypervirulence associated protein TUDOR domain-containing protein n=1 Tax=Aspergillus sydowii CBS 593.65 TaxID=1036612 RepID=A0A1L9TED9_9EURO|nr:uncharacterized protein ASPSYDRAFT_47001 [Aspergillus sydowii CBS 593.65]OJJ57776.1 hypothetical protein ASPSYDRAFT_47001 [Aspergillus sydowii CBS 593.65]